MLKLGIIGSGFGQYGLLPAFRSVKDCEVVALCGRKRPQLLQYCERIGFTNIYDDWRELLKREALDALAIAVTPAAQYQIAKAAIGKGLHIFAEKPLAANAKQARELFTLAKKKKIIHGVDFLFPEIAQWQKTKELLDERSLGKLQHLSVNWDFLSYDIAHRESSWKTNTAQGGGALAFYFSHGLHYIEHFAGKIRKMQTVFTHARESRNGAEVGVDMVVAFEHGATGNIHVCCNSRGLTRHQLMFQCERGSIVLENDHGIVDHFTVTVRTPEREERIRVKGDRSRKNEGERVKIVRKLATRFVRCCLTKKPMSPSFEDGARVQDLIEMARRGG